MTSAILDYAKQVERFAAEGAAIYKTAPGAHYTTEIARGAKRPMEPGFIPPDRPARIVTVSYYPNASELPRAEYDAATQSLETWAKTGTVADYKAAYRDWLAMLPHVPFYRDFNKPIFDQLNGGIDEFAWLPLIKLPLPAGTKVSEEDIWVDRFLVGEQLLLLKPKVILAQGVQVYDVVSGMCEDKFPHHIVCQKLGRVGTSAYHAAEDNRVVDELRMAMEQP